VAGCPHHGGRSYSFRRGGRNNSDSRSSLEVALLAVLDYPQSSLIHGRQDAAVGCGCLDIDDEAIRRDGAQQRRDESHDGARCDAPSGRGESHYRDLKDLAKVCATLLSRDSLRVRGWHEAHRDEGTHGTSRQTVHARRAHRLTLGLTVGRWVDLAKFDQLEPERLYLCENPVDRRRILERAREHRLAAADLRSHRAPPCEVGWISRRTAPFESLCNGALRQFGGVPAAQRGRAMLASLFARSPGARTQPADF
jgi:hypothetical protein